MRLTLFCARERIGKVTNNISHLKTASGNITSLGHSKQECSSELIGLDQTLVEAFHKMEKNVDHCNNFV